MSVDLEQEEFENASVLQRQLDQQRSFVDNIVSNTRLIEFLKLL
ncbi:hypothetical protein Pint_21202 [Pistacia integerrima]|uniref:Uncharacterized protein n=1 Tax=Pistacia integerrima TaxID=434235 RepID=A0ACC0XC99_9ROSI|nr:hypothetical protein Pint_21202 [Pistacia integerrima]